MRLGISGVLPKDLREIDRIALQQVRSLGFSGAAVSFSQDPAEVSKDLADKVRDQFAEAGVAMVEQGQYSSNLVDADPAVRRQWVTRLQSALKVSQWLGCAAVITGAGSRSPRSAWFAHPENHSAEAVSLLVASLKEAVKAAEEHGVILALECHTVTTLKDPEVTREIVEAVGSPMLKVHLDPVNWITFHTYFQNGAYIDRMFDLLTPYLLGCHAKDVVLEDRLIVHLDEAPAGQGVLDYHTLLRRFAEVPGDPWLVIEHTPLSQIPAARAYVAQRAAEAGVVFR